MTKRIPIEFLVEPRLVSFEAACRALGLSRTTFWKERSLGKIKVVSYNRVPIEEINRYASAELKHVRTINLNPINHK